jgi:hypothetical protein
MRGIESENRGATMTKVLCATRTATAMIAALVLLTVGAAHSQQPAMHAPAGDANWIKGEWLVSVTGEETTRALDVANVQATEGSAYALEASYGVAGTRLQAVAAELRRVDDKWTIGFTTPIGAAIAAQSTDEKAFSGTITYKNGTSKPLAMMPANLARHWLGREEVAALLIGKRVTFVRLRDGAQITWQLDDGGALYAHNSKGQNDNGSWQLGAQGELCLTWRGNSGDGCLYVFRDGANGPLMFTPQKSPSSPPWSKLVSP